MIDFTRAFDTAWERMMVILFRPFDLGKWCVIGFSAFLAGLLSGGNGINSFNLPTNFSPQHQQQEMNTRMTHLMSQMAGLQTGLIVVAVIGGVIFWLALTVLVNWLGARGQFLLLDNIVRNRAEIGLPWKAYARPANRVFFFQLVLKAAGLLVILFLGGLAFLIAWPSMSQHHHLPEGAPRDWLIVLAAVFVVFWLVLNVFLFLFREWTVPLMFRHDLTVGAALAETWWIACTYPGTTFVFLLLRLALWLALAVLSLAACCFFCVGLVPYAGTVVLLPALLYIRCFSLECLAQFGPECDVWTVDVPPTLPPPPG